MWPVTATRAQNVLAASTPKERNVSHVLHLAKSVTLKTLKFVTNVILDSSKKMENA